MKNKSGCASCKPSQETSQNHQIKMLVGLFPILKIDHRELKENEIESEAVFKELFPNKEIDLGLLKAIYQYQQLKKSK